MKELQQWRTHDGRKAVVMVDKDGTVTVHIDVLKTIFAELGWEEIVDGADAAQH